MKTSTQVKQVCSYLENTHKALKILENGLAEGTTARRDLHSAVFHIDVALTSLKRAGKTLKSA